MALVRFVSTTRAGFTGIDTKDSNTLYFLSDERRIYKGETPYTGGIFTTVSEFPVAGEVNNLYVNTNTGQVSYWNGVSYQTVVPATGKSISGAGDDDHLATTKAVVDYVTQAITDLDVTSLTGRVTTLEGEMDDVQASIETINGSGEGSISKAKQDAIDTAKNYTDSQVATKANLVHTHEMADVNGLTDALAGKSNVGHVHEISEVTGLDTALAGKADKANTLAGYGITDAYTKGETDNAISTAVANANHLKREIVEELPEVEAANEQTIYMVGPSGQEGNQKYEEFMLINGAFEKIGDSAVDLTGYATESYVNGAITTAIGELDVEDTAVPNQYVSQIVETDGKIAVTRVDLPVTSVTEGVTNGSIAVNGSDVAVHGLGSAAYTNTEAYEAAGTAAAAIAALDKTDSAQEGQYVSAVSQEDGVITVQRAALPTAPKITTGSTNGTIAVGGEDVAVKGLGSAAYTESNAYATAAQGALAESAVQAVTESVTPGSISVDGVDVAVHGLGSAAYTSSGDYATAAQGTKADQVFEALTWQEA